MPATINLTLNDSQTLKAIASLTHAGEDLTPVMREIVGILADAAEQAFADEADPDTSTPWVPLTEAHIEKRRDENKWPGAILQMTGDLAKSIQSDYGNDFAQVGSNKIYAAIHQHGGTADMPARNAAIPARPFLGASEQDREEIMDVLKRHLSDAIR